MARSDFSNFIVHLTKGNKAAKNLINILKQQTIEAKKVHCVFGPKIISKQLGFTSKLRNAFKTVCFTETPIDQIQKLTEEMPERNIKLKPYGLVFSRDYLLEKGANPAFYLNSKGTALKKYLIDQFDYNFSGIKKYKEWKEQEDDFYREIIQYYSLINDMSSRYDFSWEREWRYCGNFKFNYTNLVAIVAEAPKKFHQQCEPEIPDKKKRYFNRTPIISPSWNYEDIISELSNKIWKMEPPEDD